jgi:hypothetical protein
MLAIIVATTVVDIALHLAGFFPSLGVPLDNRQSLTALSYRIVISIAGAWLTARLAPARPMKHALILGAIGTVLGAVGVAATLSKNLGPAWYPVSLAVLAVPQCWVGGRIYQARHSVSYKAWQYRSHTEADLRAAWRPRC